ncbi:AMP-binding protein [Gracilinema caldarium]|uniref:Long-chain-fatty-acid--CoA ligase n=1 Tax=Gracilinema caldarium (strain ATCC 51460 / DSM 7334 / H1) TaxID=744872 RepID=F8F3S2_GRAC1|nr:AMP-binding protein [Gracilinema caldarium]AEJ20441.1 Long-chain-fatty-acid--CoA ligase [Gracilinema caldarium DSM 7334]
MVRLERRTLTELVQASSLRFAKRTVFSLFSEGTLSNLVTYEDFGKLSTGVASVLQQLGLKKGDRVMLLSENRPEWPISYFGISLAGTVIVPILTDFIAEHIGTIARHAEISAVCATEKTLAKIKIAGISEDIPLLRIDEMDSQGIMVSIKGQEVKMEFKPLIPYKAQEDEVATIIYTSGTTGSSKGVMLSHRNLIFEAQACRSIIKIYPRDRFLSVLPLAHTYECTIGMLIAVLNGASTTYLGKAPTPAILMPALELIRPTIMLTVPLIIEKTYRTKIKPSLETHPLYKIPLTKPLAIKVAGTKLIGSFGGAIRFFGIGGAALAADVEDFLQRAGFPYAIGYGLTETAPLLAGAPPFKSVLRSTGPALKGVELRIVDQNGHIVGGAGAPKDAPEHAEGEIQARGPNVMLGYYKDPEKTAEVFTSDGWFKTGDLGSMDKKGRLFIRGRLKAMILGPSGENIYPEEIESILNSSGYVEDSLVYATEKGELVALVVLSEKAKTMFAATSDILHEAGKTLETTAHNVGQATQHAAQGTIQGIQHLLQELKNTTNKRLAGFSRIHRVELQDEPFEKTATQKIKRFLYPKKKS